MNSIQPVMLQPNTQPALNANEQRVVEASDTEYSLQYVLLRALTCCKCARSPRQPLRAAVWVRSSRPSQAQGVKGCVLLTSERVVWTAAVRSALRLP
jgi:hypothetical protein